MCTGAETKSQFCKPLKHDVKSMMDLQDWQAVIPMEDDCSGGG
jgi:hypothetical protein